MRLSLALVLGFVAIAPPQEALTLEELLRKSEAAAEAARGSTFRIKAADGGAMAALFMQSTGASEVAVAKDGTVRVMVEPTEADAKLMGMSRSTPRREMLLAEDGLTLVEEWPARTPLQGLLRRRTERLSPDSAGKGDPFVEMSAWGMPMSDIAGLMFHTVSPRRAMAFERGLELLGKRRIGAEEFYVVMARRKMEAGEGPMQITGIVKKYYFSAADFRLRRLDVRLASSQEFQDFRMTWRIEEYEGALPSKFSGTISIESLEDYTWTLKFESADVKKGLDLPAAALRPSAADLYATRSRDAEIEKLLEKSPNDADLNWSFAVARSSAAASPMMGRGGPAADPGPVVAALERTVAASWTPAPVRSLLALYTTHKEQHAEKLAALLERLRKDERRTPEMALDGAEACNLIGKPDLALEFLEKLDGAPRTRVAEERIAARLAKGELTKAFEEFASVATPAWVARLKALYDGAGEEIKKLVTRADLVKAMDAAVAASPKSPVLHLARLRILEEGGDIDALAAAIKAAFEQAADKTVDDAALDILGGLLGHEKVAGGPMIVVPGGPAPKAKPDAEKVKGSIQAIRAALDAAGQRPMAAILRAQADVAAGDREAAAKDFASACDLAAASPDAAALASRLVEALEGFNDDVLMERACKIYFEKAPKGSIGIDLMMGMRRQASPITAYAKLCMAGRKYVDLYRAVKGIDFGTSMGFAMFLMQGGQTDGSKDFFTAAKEEAFKDSKDIAGVKWLARQVASGERFGAFMTTGLDATELWQKVHEWAPKDLEALQSIADGYVKKSDREKATKACEEILAALASGATCDRPWSVARARLTMAELIDGEARKVELAKIDLGSSELAAWELWRLAELFEEGGLEGQAVAAMHRLEQEGYRPYVKLAQLHLKAERWMEAMRSINRAIAFGDDGEIRKPSSMFDRGLQPVEPEPKKAGPEQLRLDLIKKVGEDWFIDRMLESKLPVLGEADGVRAREALARVSSDDLGERDDAMMALRKIGPGCAAILKPGLKSEDEETRLRIRALLNEWAEPK